MDEYAVGQTLGEGAFGVVSVCKKRATGQEFAVKMVDKVETPVEAIKKEADMLASMDHPNIVKFHGVYYERCFVCIVMDKLDGGDLVEGLQRHLKERGQINCLDVVHVAYQMASSISYLHNRNVVHRDVKGDNYLMDRKNMTDGQCKIVLTDFGTACNCKPSDRLSSGVGTKIFWPPEFFDREYGQKVDVWAMGVIMYGLVSGRFPFRDENDVRNKEVRIPKRVHPVCEEYIRKMLDKSEKTRMSSSEVMAHPWIAGKFGQTTAGDNKPTEEEGDKEADGMVEAGVNDGIKERRQELILRMNREAESRKGISTKKQLQNHKHKKFVVADKIVQGGKASYEWMSEDQVKKDRLLDFDNKSAAPKDDPMDLAMFRKTLVEHQIDPNVFGVAKAKGLDQLAKEVETGASRLMLDAQQHKKLVRVVDVVVLKLRPSDGSRLLVESKALFKAERLADADLFECRCNIRMMEELVRVCTMLTAARPAASSAVPAQRTADNLPALAWATTAEEPDASSAVLAQSTADDSSAWAATSEAPQHSGSLGRVRRPSLPGVLGRAERGEWHAATASQDAGAAARWLAGAFF